MRGTPDDGLCLHDTFYKLAFFMGRPKVRPENRLRVNTACTTCRASKKRCSGTFPCTNCVHKGRARACIPFKSMVERSPQGRTSPHSQQTIQHSPVWQDSTSNVRGSEAPQILGYSNDRHLEAGSRSPEAAHRTLPRMLRNLQGERVYVGKAASLSFLQLLRDTVTQHIGPSQFSHNFKSEDMLETEAHHDPLNFLNEPCSIEEKRHFIKTFYTVTSGFLCFSYNMDTLLSSAEPQNDREKTRAAIVDLVIAIGAQSCLNDPGTVQTERFFFTRGQRRTFANFLEDPSMDLVRAFLLMSFYMFGACRRNAAYMYLGVATRSAGALGLHTDSSASLSSAEQQERSELWMSLCVIDLLASSILGRPAATAGLLPQDREDRRSFSQLATSPTKASLIASYRLALILEEIISRLYSEKAASTETADLLLAKLNRWGNHLPGSLRSSFSVSDDPDAAREQIIGNMHVACSYHFAVILVTRPFLISTLSIRLARLHQSLSSVCEVSDALEEDPAHSRLAAACIDSAVFMLQTCLEVHQSNLLLRNMSLLKAFIFAAALVIGFSMFSSREIDSEVDAAFTGALTVLRMLAPQSAQAAHYLEILMLLEAAVNQQRQRLTAQARQRRSQYVSRIFSLNETPTTGRSQIEEVEGSRAVQGPPLLAQGQPASPFTSQDDWPGTVTPQTIDGIFVDWEGMELPLWDSFPFTESSSTIL